MSEDKDQDLVVQDDVVVTMHYVLEVDGQIMDRSEDDDPIQFMQGHGHIVPGLERELYGMSPGEKKQVDVSPQDGYGEVEDDSYALVPRDEFPEDIPMEEGVALQLRDEDGDIFDAYIVGFQGDDVRLDFNHPLAGKDLHFEVTVVELRPATQEEIDHGHVHSG